MIGKLVNGVIVPITSKVSGTRASDGAAIMVDPQTPASVIAILSDVKPIDTSEPRPEGPGIINVEPVYIDDGGTFRRTWAYDEVEPPMPDLLPPQWENFLDDSANRTGGPEVAAIRTDLEAAVAAMRASGDFAMIRTANAALASPTYGWASALSITQQSLAAGLPAPDVSDPAVVAELEARWRAAAADYV